MSALVDHDRRLSELRERLAQLQQPQIDQNRRAIILFEGVEGSAKKVALRQLAAAFDPCHFAVHRVGFDRREANEGHWLARYWRQLPVAGCTAIFFRSWYRRVLDDRVLGRIDDKTAARAFDEINEFEAQQRDAGTLIVKLLFAVDADVQRQRLAPRTARDHGHDGEPIIADDPRFVRALGELKANTDTRWSPWRMIDGNDERVAAIAALESIAEAWDQAMAGDPVRLADRRNRAA